MTLLNTDRPTAGAHAPAAVARLVNASCVFPSGGGVHDLRLEIPAGSIFGFIGPSGSGKTTTVRLLTGVAQPTSGIVEVFGRRPAEFGIGERSRLGYMPQLTVLYPNLSVWENLRFLASLYGLGPDRRPLQDALEFVELAGHEHKRVRDISGGMQRRLSLAATLVHQPDVIFMDEPTAGIDPVLRRKFWDHFRALSEQGRTLFVTTQYVGEAAYCDRVGVLADGRILTVDSPDGLRRRAYGGDVIHVDFVQPPPASLLEELGRLAGASQIDLYSARRLRLVVEEAATALPEISAWLGSRGIDIDQAEEFVPPFDDVFVALVEAADGQDSEVSG